MVAAAPRFSPSRLTPSLGVGLWILITLALPAAHGSLATQADPAEGFRLALPGYSYAFPRDHGSHDEFRTEWWYYTGHLTSEDGRRFGYQLTFFRRGIAQTDRPPNPSRWAIRHLYLAHFAVTDVNGGRFVYDEKVSRAALGKAGAATGRLHTWIDRWAATADGRMLNQSHPTRSSPRSMEPNSWSIQLPPLTENRSLLMTSMPSVSIRVSE